MARVAYIGNFEPVYSTENDVRKAFEHLGHEVIQLQENKFDINRLGQFDYDLLLITGTWDDAKPLDSMITHFMHCAARGIPTATLHLDTFWGKSRGGRQWWLHPMFHTAYIFTADGDYQEQWKTFGKNHIWLPPAVRHDAAHFGKYRPEYDCDVAFVGSNGVGYHEDVWSYRKELVDALRDMCKRNGWSFKNPGGDDPKVDRGEDMNDFYASAKVTVGDSLCLKKEESHYWSDRVPEATGRGGFLIMPKIRALERLYPVQPDGLKFYEWNNFKDLEEEIGVWLSPSFSDIWRRQKRYTQAITARDHTYVNRVQTILKEVGVQ